MRKPKEYVILIFFFFFHFCTRHKTKKQNNILDYAVYAAVLFGVDQYRRIRCTTYRTDCFLLKCYAENVYLLSRDFHLKIYFYLCNALFGWKISNYWKKYIVIWYDYIRNQLNDFTRDDLFFGYWIYFCFTTKHHFLLKYQHLLELKIGIPTVFTSITADKDTDTTLSLIGLGFRMISQYFFDFKNVAFRVQHLIQTLLSIICNFYFASFFNFLSFCALMDILRSIEWP